MSKNADIRIPEVPMKLHSALKRYQADLQDELIGRKVTFRETALAVLEDSLIEKGLLKERVL